MTRENQAKPAAIKRLAGNPGKRPINDGPKALGKAQPPKNMSPQAMTVWKRLLGCMPNGVYLSTDEFILAAFSEAVALHQFSSEMIQEHGPVSTGHTGQPVISPWVKIQSDQARLVITLAQRLGLDPMARQQLQTEQVEVDPFNIQ